MRRWFPRLDRSEGHSFLPLPREGVVLDLGYNLGRFAAHVSNDYAARVLALEPDRGLDCQPANASIEVRQVALGDGSPTSLAFNENADASTVFVGRRSAVVETVRLETLLQELDRVDLVKLDVEGAEVSALMSVDAAELARVSQLTVEFHDFLEPALGPSVATAKARLRDEGFYELRLSRDNSNVLYVNAERVPLSRATRAWLIVRYRYLSGALRVLRRAIRKRWAR
jgi:FkbM family methyltransferase